MPDVTLANSEQTRGSAESTDSERSPRKLRLAFAGVGWIGRNRFESITRAADIDVVAIADPAADVAAQLAASRPNENVWCTRAFEDLLPLDLDGIVIATPSALHARQAIAALETGKAVFCQKPLARTAAEAEAVISAARQANRLLGVDMSYRFTSGMRQIRQLIGAGKLGRVYAIEAVFHNAYGPDKAWFYDLEAAGGGCLLDLGIHLIDLALWCLDFPAVEQARGVARAKAGLDFRPGAGVDDYATAQIEFEGGASMQLACSWRVPAGCDARIELTFFGTGGGASFRNVNGSFLDFVAEYFPPDRSRRVLAEPPDAWSGRAAIDWTQRLALSSAFDPEIQHVSTVATVLDRLYGRTE